jgi:hypothetical protein
MTNIFSDLLPKKEKEEKLQKPNIFSDLLTSEEEDPNLNVMRNDSITPSSLENDKLVKEVAKRFAKDRSGIETISEEDAYDNFLEHFRKFSVNEFTAGSDWNYISAASADSVKDPTAQQKLEDYAFLYKKFHSLPNWHGGVGTALGDYFEGISTAPSTLAGVFLPGLGKVLGVGAGATAKVGVSNAVSKVSSNAIGRTLGKLLPTNIIGQAAKRPIVTGMAIEGTAGGLQNIAKQNVELEIGEREKFSPTDTAVGVGVGMAVPGFLGVIGAKMAAGKAVSSLGQGSKLSDSIITDIDKSIIKKNAKANKAADKTLNDKTNVMVSKKIKETLPELDPKRVAEGKSNFSSIAAQDAINPDLVARLDVDRTKRVWALVTDLISTDKRVAKSFITNNKNADGTWKVRATEAMSNILAKKLATSKVKTQKLMGNLYEKYNLTGDDMANLFLAQWSEAGKTLKQASDFKKVFSQMDDSIADTFGMDKSLRESIAKLNKSVEQQDVRGFLQNLEEGQALGYIRSLDQVRLAMMTSQTATTFRNTVSGYARIGMDTLVNTFDRSLASGIQKITGGKFGGGKVGITGNPNDDIFSLVFGLSNKQETMLINDIFKLNFNKQAQNLFRELRDIADATGNTSNKLTKARAIGRQLNALNTLSDNYFKRIAFVSNIKKKLNENFARTVQNIRTLEKTKPNVKADEFRKLVKNIPSKDIQDKLLKGTQISKTDIESLSSNYNIIDMIKKDTFTKYFNTKQGKKVLDDTIKDSLYFTYQANPEGSLGRTFVTAMQSVPFLTTSFVPFPRFIANAMRFTYEYSPLYLVQGGYRSLVKDADNYQEVGKALAGSAMFLGALAFRNTDAAGDNWWEGKLPNGETFDLRPFFPASPYLYAADLFTRAFIKKDPVIDDRNFLRNSVQALTGTQFRAGMGLYLFEEGLGDIFDSTKDGDERYFQVKKLALNIGSNIVSTYTIPITPVKDVYDTFIADDDKRLVRETKSSNLLQMFL